MFYKHPLGTIQLQSPDILKGQFIFAAIMNNLRRRKIGPEFKNNPMVAHFRLSFDQYSLEIFESAILNRKFHKITPRSLTLFHLKL